MSLLLLALLVGAHAQDATEPEAVPPVEDLQAEEAPDPGERGADEASDPGEVPVPQDAPATDEAPVPQDAPATDEAPAPRKVPVPAAVPVPLEAPDPEPPERARRTRFDWSGHVKSFAVVSLPYAVDLPDDVVHDLLNPLPSEPTAQAFLDGRLNLSLEHDDWLVVEAAHAVTTFINADSTRDMRNAELVEPLLGDDALGAFADLARLEGLVDADALTGGGGTGGPFTTGVGARAPEAFPLTWVAFTGDGPRDLRVQGRTDRLLVRFKLPKVDVTVGRQPIGFGTGMFFTPLDLVNPFTPATIDTEYKPGVDAVRVDAYPTFSSRVTAVAAYTGRRYIHEPLDDDEPASDRVAAAAFGTATVGVTDLGLFYGFIRGDHVVGASMASSAGPVGLHADATVTVPREDLDEPVFFRGVFGVDGRPTGTTTLSGEVYVQTFGSVDTDDLFTTLGSERFQRGEVWLGGLAYLGFAVGQEITPLLIGNVGVIANLTDPSVLLTPSLSWSVAGNVDAVFGGYVGLGRRPEAHAIDLDDPELTAADLQVIRPRSELGTYPATLFMQLRAYF